MLQDTFKVTGKVLFRRYDENGKLNLEREHKNLVVTTGKQLIAARLFSDTTKSITITSVSGDGFTATIGFDVQTGDPYYSSVPFEQGAYVTVVGVVPETYNGTYRIKTVGTTFITVDSAATGSMTTAGIIQGTNNSTVKTMRIGDSSTVANLSDSALYTERGSVDLYSRATNIEDDVAELVYIGFFPSGVGTSTTPGLSEAGLFNAEGKMLCRTVFPIIPKQSTESLEIFWTVTIN